MVVVVGGNVVVVVVLVVVVLEVVVVDELVVMLEVVGAADSPPHAAATKAMPIKMGRRLTSQLRGGRSNRSQPQIEVGLTPPGWGSESPQPIGGGYR